jgi:hypothetical protein
MRRGLRRTTPLALHTGVALLGLGLTPFTDAQGRVRFEGRAVRTRLLSRLRALGSQFSSRHGPLCPEGPRGR